MFDRPPGLLSQRSTLNDQLSFRSGLSTKKPVPPLSRDTLKDQYMKKIRSLAVAGLFVIVAARCSADSVTEDFSSDPLQNGWAAFGNTNLFQWTNQSLAVTWDSTQPNSYFYKPLGTTLTKDDDFSISFDLQLNDAVASNFGAPIAVGLFHFNDATNTAFSRGTGNAANFCEFNFFPDTGFGYSIDATLKDAQGGYDGFYFAYDNLPLAPATTYHVTLVHAAGALTLTGSILTNGEVYTTLPLSFGETLTNFFLDTVSISSYVDDGFGDSILAHGVVDDLVVTLPPVVRNLSGSISNGVWQATVNTYAGWVYTLQRTADFQDWTDIGESVAGTGATISLSDQFPPADNAFYRVKAEPPFVND